MLAPALAYGIPSSRAQGALVSEPPSCKKWDHLGLYPNVGNYTPAGDWVAFDQVCCNPACVYCGGSMCESGLGPMPWKVSVDQCCLTAIIEKGVTCGTPPCIEPPSPPPPPGPKADRIICPVLASGFASGKLETIDDDGNVELAGMKKFLDALGVKLGQVEHLPFPFSLFELDGTGTNGGAFEHGLSSGIRDPSKSRANLDAFLAFADADGVMGTEEMAAGGKWFDENPNHETHVVDPARTGTEFTFVNFFLPIFGRCGTKKRVNPNPYAEKEGDTVKTALGGSIPCTADKLFMLKDDVEAMFWQNTFPDGFHFL